MTDDTDARLDLWTSPADDDEEAAAAFRRLYTDPVLVDGVPLTALDLVARARGLRDTLADPQREVLGLVADGDQVAEAFRLTGRHVRPLGTQLGPVTPSGKTLSIRVIDLLTLEGGRIAEIQMVADELAALRQADAVALVAPGRDGAGAR